MFYSVHILFQFQIGCSINVPEAIFFYHVFNFQISTKFQSSFHMRSEIKSQRQFAIFFKFQNLRTDCQRNRGSKRETWERDRESSMYLFTPKCLQLMQLGQAETTSQESIRVSCRVGLSNGLLWKYFSLAWEQNSKQRHELGANMKEFKMSENKSQVDIGKPRRNNAFPERSRC